MADGKAIQHEGQRLDQPIQRLRQHLTTPDLGHIGSQTLAKTNDNTVFLGDEFRAETGTAAIIPDRSPQRREPLAWRDPPYALQVVAQLGLFGLQLRFGREMLQGTAPAHSKMGATGYDPCGRWLQDLQQLGLIMLAMLASSPETDALAGECTRHESRLPLSHDAFSIVRQRRDGGDFLDRVGESPRSAAQVTSPSGASACPFPAGSAPPCAGCRPLTGEASQCSRNSAKCGSFSAPPRRSTLTRSISSA